MFFHCISITLNTGENFTSHLTQNKMREAIIVRTDQLTLALKNEVEEERQDGGVEGRL